jgi:hypothetical protein
LNTREEYLEINTREVPSPGKAKDMLGTLRADIKHSHKPVDEPKVSNNR